MLKPFLIFFLALTVQRASGQSRKAITKIKRDTVLYYLKNPAKLVSDKDSADYAMFILPNDPADPKSLYPVFEYYMNGKRKLTGATHSQFYHLALEGQCMTFFSDGHRKGVVNYKHGRPVGQEIEYYPNGQVYAVKEYIINSPKSLNSRLSLVECRDSTGKILAENGNGHWLKFDAAFKNSYEEGPVNNGAEDGTWTIILDDKKLQFVYAKGAIVTPIDYNFTGKVFDASDVEPGFKGGIDAFYQILIRTLHYPKEDRENNVQGKVVVSFVVEVDGSLSNIKVDSAPSKTLALESLRNIQQSPPWIPGTIGGKPVRTRYTIPINFTLSGDN